MIRPILTELALFLAPFALYALFLFTTRVGVLEPANWSWPRITWLSIAALLLVIGSFVMLAEFGGAPPDSTYTPAHIKDGVFVPGKSR